MVTRLGPDISLPTAQTDPRQLSKPALSRLKDHCRDIPARSKMGAIGASTRLASPSAAPTRIRITTAPAWVGDWCSRALAAKLPSRRTKTPESYE